MIEFVLWCRTVGIALAIGLAVYFAADWLLSG